MNNRRVLALAKVYGHLETGPVVLLSTLHKKRANIMTMSWHTMMEFEPPLVGCVLSNRNHTFEMLCASKECVINIPTVDLKAAVVGCGNHSGRDMDKFKKFHLTPSPAHLVKAPLIDECFASLECRLVDAGWVEKYNFFVLQVVKAWVDTSKKNPKTLHHRGHGAFMVDGKTIQTRSKAK